jgi:hypothetical protein
MASSLLCGADSEMPPSQVCPQHINPIPPSLSTPHTTQFLSTTPLSSPLPPPHPLPPPPSITTTLIVTQDECTKFRALIIPTVKDSEWMTHGCPPVVSDMITMPPYSVKLRVLIGFWFVIKHWIFFIFYFFNSAYL